MRRTYANHLDHPMNGLFDDVWSTIKDEGAKLTDKFTSGEIVKTAVKDQTASLLQKLALNPEVQQKAADEAEKAALEKAVSTLQSERKKLMADISALTKDPIKFAKTNPMKTAIYVGIPTALIVWLFMRRK